MTQSGKAPARKIKRAHILLKADTAHADAGWTDEQISDAYAVLYCVNFPYRST